MQRHFEGGGTSRCGEILRKYGICVRNNLAENWTLFNTSVKGVKQLEVLDFTYSMYYVNSISYFHNRWSQSC